MRIDFNESKIRAREKAANRQEKKVGILKLRPSCKDYIWGGRRLVEEYGKQYEGEILAETWELSCHPDGPSVIAEGVHAGKTLQQFIEEQGKEVLGTHCRRFRDFPILIKLIDARDNLSIQVHPDNRYALKNEGQYGKTEMWYVMDAGEDAFLYYGFQREISREEFALRIREDTLLEVLHAVPVQKGDVLFIESGTIHAIGRDILIAEIQQNSNVTYRVYDYGRNGEKRDLHIEKALAVTNRVPIIKDKSSYPHVADCDYFTVDKLNLDGIMMKKMEGSVTERSFVSILVLDGEGAISCQGETLTYRKGDSFFLAAGSGAYNVEGSCDALVTTIREKAGPVRIGVHIGTADTRIGLVDVHQKVIASRVIATKAGRGAEIVAAETAAVISELLEQEGISMDQCTGIGIGVPGTVDCKNGIVRYSNNIRWENADLAGAFGRLFPLPIRVANDADTAALGEAAAGAGRDYRDMVMLTLGAGVGSGVILDGRIYEGGRFGGIELGHMVIAENGKPCTCGRRGCLEAYVSASALSRETERALGKAMTLQELFEMAVGGDTGAQAVADDYMRKLGTGIANIVNVFRPQLVLLGGEVGQCGEWLLESLRHIVQRDCFGGMYGEIPEVEAAALGEEAGVIGAASLL